MTNKKAKLITRCYSIKNTNSTNNDNKLPETHNKNVKFMSIKNKDNKTISNKKQDKNINNNSNQTHYKFELYSYGYLVDTLECEDRKTAIKYFYSCDSSFDFGFKLFINNKLIEYKNIRKSLGLTNRDYLNYYFKSSNNI